MNIKEIGAYLKIKGGIDPETRKLIEKVYVEAQRAPFFKRVAKFSIENSSDGVKLIGTDIVLTGNLAKKHFENCRFIYVILGTLGQESERKMRETYALSPTRGLVLDACYSEYLERQLDAAEGEISSLGEKLTSRISCGYGDLPLKLQEPILKFLGARQIGVYMNESCMLTPNKSVVALVGVKEE